ncbi:MAG: 30S ribosomal protein S18 [Patescibacteria group bacterium]
MPAPKKEQPKACYFCVQNRRAPEYTEAGLLRRFVSSYMKIAPRRRSGLCAKHQRKVANAIKRARVAGLMPFVSR